MPPNSKAEENYIENDGILDAPTKAAPRKYDIIYANVLGFIYFHMAGIYGLYLAYTSAKWQTFLFTYIMHCLTILGVTAGVHRLWSHKSYKARMPLQIFLMICQCISYQLSIFHWVKDHRLHHKYCDTDADPHNVRRGFFYSHIGWIMVKQHPEVKKRRKVLDLSDLYANPVVMFQERYKDWLLPFFAFLLPPIIPMLLWDESFTNSWHINCLRYVLTLHQTFVGNSVAHTWGSKPYDKTMSSTQSMPFSLILMGDGFHNYHHTFPYDYRASEFGNYSVNFITWFIDICAFFGLAYDLRTASEGVIKTRAGKTGDGSDMWGFKKD